MPRKDQPIDMLCLYRIKQGREPEFIRLLEKHWPTLLEAGLATDEPAKVFRCSGKDGRTFLVERFAWKHGRASEEAHRRPEVLAVWGPMEELVESMEFAVIEPVRMPFE